MIISFIVMVFYVVEVSPLCGNHISIDIISFCYRVLNTQTLLMSKKYVVG